MNLIQRLLLTLAIALTALVFVGGFGAKGLSQSQERLSYIQQAIAPNISALNSIKTDFSSGRILGYRHSFTYDADEKLAVENDIAKIDTSLAQTFTTYAGRVLDNHDDEMLKQDQQALNAYKAIRTDMLSKSTDNDTKGAKELLIGSLSEKADAFEKSLSAHIAYTEQIATETNRKNDEAYALATKTLFSIIITGLVITGALAFNLYRAISGSLKAIQNTIRKVSETLDFTFRAPILRNDEIGQTTQAFNELLDRLQINLKAILSGAEQVVIAAQEMADNADKVAEASNVQSEASGNMAASIEELTVSINHLSTQANDALTLARTSGELAKSGSDTIVKTIGDIRNISDSVSNVAQSMTDLDAYNITVARVVQVIREVADQTNLLALNAAIEAARAGEQGRGFAVVADEVRLLAQRTSASTSEISQAVDAMRSKSHEVSMKITSANQLVKNGVDRADNADHAIREIGQSALASAEVVHEITNALKEQGIASDNIAMHVDKIAHMAEEASAAIADTAAVARRVDELAEIQMETLRHYKL